MNIRFIHIAFLLFLIACQPQTEKRIIGKWKYAGIDIEASRALGAITEQDIAMEMFSAQTGLFPFLHFEEEHKYYTTLKTPYRAGVDTGLVGYYEIKEKELIVSLTKPQRRTDTAEIISISDDTLKLKEKKGNSVKLFIKQKED